jgi:dipeptidyl-peptidase-4
MNIPFKLKSFIQATVFLTLLIATQHGFAQGTRSDYERALSLSETITNKVFKDRVTAHWLKDNKRLWYRNDLPEGKREFIFVDTDKAVRRPAFDHEKLAESLSKVIDQEVDAEKLAIDRLIFDETDSSLTFSYDNSWWKCDLKSYKIEATSRDESATSSLEPLRRWRSSRRTGEETSITFINRTDEAVDIYWIDTERQRKHYTTVAAGDQHRQHTFAGHVWLVTDKNGQPLLTFMAEEQVADAVIDEETINEAANRRQQGLQPLRSEP